MEEQYYTKEENTFVCGCFDLEFSLGQGIQQFHFLANVLNLSLLKTRVALYNSPENQISDRTSLLNLHLRERESMYLKNVYH